MILRFSEAQIKHPCGGNGTCHKCRIRFLEDAPEATDADREVFSVQELALGYRLSCQVPEETESLIEVSEDLLATGDMQTILSADETKKEEPSLTTDTSIAIDLGTTTIAFALFDGAIHRVTATYGMANPQSVYGADVISRIKAATEGKDMELQQVVCGAIVSGCRALIACASSEKKDVRRIFIGGNTTMIHLLLGLSVEGLARFPFTPQTLSAAEISWRQMKSFAGVEEDAISDETRIFFVPAISAFVGGDITSGIYGLRMTEQKKTTLLVDLGTNGEMALFDGERLFVTSTAAGPAFEGANLSCGMASTSGAIVGVLLPYRTAVPRLTVIGDTSPLGLCGTGAISLLSQLFKLHLIDEHGTLQEPYREDGYPVAKRADGSEILFLQEDIRAIQMAKAAIAAGVEILLQEAHIEMDAIAEIDIAGGMGTSLARDDAIAIGLFDQAYKEKLTSVGNSCMTGLLRMAKKNDFDVAKQMVQIPVTQVELANHAAFEESFLHHMDFS